MSKATLPKSSIDFLKTIKKNNNRDWFAANKDLYIEQQQHLINFADEVLLEMNKHDHIDTVSGKKSLFRIYRDTRFSKDKTPYKHNWSGSFKRTGKALRGGYYFHIEPGKSFVGGGFWGPNPKDLKRVRDEFTYDAAPMRKILKSKVFKDTFGELKGDQVKTSPKGFGADDPNIDLLRFKSYIVMKPFTDKEVLDPKFARQVSDTFKKMRPLFDYMSEVLTTDTNGISII